MKIRKLQLKNIGVFDDETIEFQPCPAKDKAEIHIFTGQNGSGKTTILMSLATLFTIEVQGKSVPEKDIPFIAKDRWFEAQLNLRSNNFEKRIRKGILEAEDQDFNSLVSFLVCYKNELKPYNFGFSYYPQNFSVIEVNTLDLKNFVDEAILSYPTRLDNYSKYRLDFAAFAFSGYRKIKDERINLSEVQEENPLYQALDFIKTENSGFTINQWLGRNLSRRALALEAKSKESEKFTHNVQNLEKIISSIIDYEIQFRLKTDLSLVIVKDNQELDFDVLPDGLKSLISWIGDLLMRLDSLEWENNLSIFEREIILFLDEIEVHLHPEWQRKVLPVVQKLFKKAQIFVSTHSPFVVNSIDDAWVYKLELENGKARVAEVVRSEDGISYQTVLSEIFDIDEEFGGETQEDLNKFYKIVRNGKRINQKELLILAKSLAEQSDELNAIVQIELRQLSRRKGKEFSI